MIKNIILDIGQVLADFRWKEYIKDLQFEKEIEEKVIKATVQNDEHWGEHDRGTLSDEEYIEKCLTIEPGIEKELRLFFERIGEIVTEYDYAEAFIKSLKEKGYHVYILSNYGKTTFEYAEKNFRFLRHVDGKIISSEVHYIKPEKEIYKILMDTYGIIPEESIFIDDKIVNVEGARKAGFYGIVFETLNQAVNELKTLGVEYGV